MTVFKCAFVILLALSSSGVKAWIVDMAEVDRSEDMDQFQEQADYEDANSAIISDDSDNEVTYTSNYAENYQYGTFTEKEVSSVLHDGGEYLAGLSGALAAYRRVLHRCSTAQGEPRQTDEELKVCYAAEQKKHLVQELSETALTTTNKLRDKGQIQMQDKSDEEIDLIQLARSLDRLATLTGYNPAQNRISITAQQPPDNSATVTTKATADVTKEENQENLEILEQVESGLPLSNVMPTPLENSETKSVQKRDISDVMKYYIKYKVWNGSNLMHNQSRDNIDEMDPQNGFKVVRKRSVPDKKAANMRAVIDKMRRLKCKIKEKITKSSVAKLVKSIKVYRTKVIDNTI